MLNTAGRMQLKWYQILYFHLMCVGLTLSQNTTSDGLPAEPFILYSNYTNLRSLDLISFAQANVLGGQNEIILVDVDTVYQHIYFGDYYPGRISRSNYDGSNVSIIMERVVDIEGLAVDWINRLMYWTQHYSATIEVATLDGMYRTVLINTELQYPRGIAVDPIAGYIFWSAWGSAGIIERSFLDGSNRVTLVTNNNTFSGAVTLDTSQRIVYWTDWNRKEVSSVDYDGNNRRLIFDYSSLPFHYLFHFFGFNLDISGDNLYFSEWYTIYEVKISAGALVRNISVQTIHSYGEVMGLRVIHSAKQQAGTSNCGNDNGGCEQLCFHEVPSGRSCGCQFGMKLASDGKSCEHNGDLPSIVLSTNAKKYTLLGAGIHFRCGFSTRIYFWSYISKIEIIKDGTPFFHWMVRYYYYRHFVYTPQYSARQNHTGKYQCKMTIGTESRYSSPFHLTVGVPSGPVVLEGEPETSATGIRLTWKPISKQFWNGEEITFQVNVSSLDYTLEKSLVTKTTSAIISGLLPTTKYIVDITGKTVFGPTKNRTVVVKTRENFDRCEDVGSNGCHKYATCKDVEVGTFICTCFEGFFGDGKECKGPPQIKSKSPVKIIENVEMNLTLVCAVIADPNPTIVWKHIDADGKVREIDRTALDKLNGSYTIHNARVEDSGTYLCNASNALGYAFYTTEVKIERVIVNISVEINLSNKKFNEELKNKSSSAYKELKDDVYIELYKIFNNTRGFEDVDILGFVNGSVKVLFRVIFKVLKPSKETNDVVAVKVGKQIYKQLKTGRIGKFTVIASTLKLKAEPPPPANVSYSDVRETKVDIFWDPPELHQLFSIKRYYISYLKHGEKKWSNDTVGVNDDASISFQLNNLESDTFYTLKVTAENEYYLGKESKRMEIKTLKVKVLSPWYYIGPIIAVACVVLMVAVACWVRRVSFSDAWRPAEDGRLHRSEKERKTTFQMIERGQQNQNTYTNPAFSNTLAKPSWQELQRILIEVSDETLIPGEFGIKIVRGTFSCVLGKDKEACSVKLLKENGTSEDRRELMNELKTISAISSHENIVNLIGACTSEDGPLLLVLEFCPRGTLESNLRESDKKREMFINKNKMSLANEIAKGMKHLADSRIVHRDLAAKNILMTADFTPKICNLGFCCDIYEESLYQKLIPGKSSTPWLAIESLTDGLYTTKSDVWSFAVVMWEIETGGDIPYQEYEVAKLVNQLKKGDRLSKPDDTSDETYKLMLQCWDENPDNRPTFEKIVEIIQKHLVNYEF